VKRPCWRCGLEFDGVGNDLQLVVGCCSDTKLGKHLRRSEGVNEVEGEAPGVASGVDIMSCPFFVGSLLSLVPMLE